MRDKTLEDIRIDNKLINRISVAQEIKNNEQVRIYQILFFMPIYSSITHNNI